jgi:hypothetical protein
VRIEADDDEGRERLVLPRRRAGHVVRRRPQRGRPARRSARRARDRLRLYWLPRSSAGWHRLIPRGGRRGGGREGWAFQRRGR